MRLKDSLETPVAMERFDTTTSWRCFVCGKQHELSLWDREIECSCGWKCDRNVNAALVVLRKWLNVSFEQVVKLDQLEMKPLEMEVAAWILESNPYICVSFCL